MPMARCARAAVKVDATYDMARENHNPMEPHATIAAWDGDRLTLWSKSQFVINEQAEIAAIFGLPAENVRVICPFVGGAFGTILRTWPHVTLAAIAARQVKRPVKLVLDPQADVLHDRPPAAHHPARRSRCRRRTAGSRALSMRAPAKRAATSNSWKR